MRVARDPETGALVYRRADPSVEALPPGVRRVVRPDGTVVYEFVGGFVGQSIGAAVLDRRTLSDGTVVYDFGPASFVRSRAERRPDGAISVGHGPAKSRNVPLQQGTERP